MPAGGYKSVMSSMFCCNRHNPECTARKRKGDDTATRPMWGAAAVKIYSGGKRQKTKKVECLWWKITLVRDGSRAKGMG